MDMDLNTYKTHLLQAARIHCAVENYAADCFGGDSFDYICTGYAYTNDGCTFGFKHVEDCHKGSSAIVPNKMSVRAFLEMVNTVTPEEAAQYYERIQFTRIKLFG